MSQSTEIEPNAVEAEAEEVPTQEKETVTVEHSPPRLSSGIALGSVFLGVLLTGPFNLVAAMFGVASLALVAGSLFLRQSRGYLSVGVGFALFGTLVAGGFGAVPPIFMLVAVSSILVGWAVGQNGLSIGEQLGSNTKTRRLELTYAGVTMLTVAAIDVVAMAVFQLSGSGRPEPAVALVIVGAIVLMWTLGE
ncbi:MAG: hypothetical protein ABEJ68_02445 [Halobacteriaceae archaeon]